MSTSCSITIRPAREPDVPDILVMIRELAAFENLEETLNVTASLLQSALFGSSPAASALVATVGNESAGYAIFYETFSSFTGQKGIFLDDVYVRPAHRKRGIGVALLEQVARVAVKRNCKRFEWIALRWNENALRLYDGIGARTLDEWTLLRMEEPRITAFATRKSPTHYDRYS